MKKYILAIATLALVVACKKVQPGGNKNILKLEEGVQRYTDDEQGKGETAQAEPATNEVKVVHLKGVNLNVNQNGLEDRIVAFLQGGKYASSDEEALKNTWYNFDQVIFKSGSSSELVKGEDQIKNLAKILKEYPEAKIKIGGYTDKSGNEESNLKLSKERALFIKTSLEKEGVGAQVVSAEGYGSQFAKAAADVSADEKAKDRKMAIRFAK